MKLGRLILVSVCLAALVLGGCTPKNAATEAGKNKTGGSVYATVEDDLGRKVVLEKKPERIAVLGMSLLNFVDAVGGKIVARPTDRLSNAVPQQFLATPEVGTMNNINLEALIAQKPDLVIVNKTQQEKIIPVLESNNIKVIATGIKTVADVERNLKMIGQVYGQPQKAEDRVAAIEKEIKGIVSKVPQKKLKIVILHATPSTVTVELENSIAGNCAQLLGFDNIAAGSTVLSGKPEKTPYSIETLVEKDPDIIFITSMGEAEPAKIEKRLKADVQSNPAWTSLRAVKTDKIYVLPERLFLLNPGLDYPDAIKTMAQKVYPELFK